MMFKAVIIGCGKIAGQYDTGAEEQVYSHARAYQLHPDIELAGMADIRIDKARELSEKYGGIYGDRPAQIIQSCQPDIVSVCTPDDTHFSVTKKVLTGDIRPKIIFLEKPACRNPRELKELLDLSKDKAIPIVVNHGRRFDAAHQQIREFIGKKTWGKLVRGDVFYYSGWQHNGVHVVDTLGYLFNQALNISKLNGRQTSPYPYDPTLDLSLLLTKDLATIYLRGFEEAYYQLFEFDLKFEYARLRIEDFGDRIIFEEKYINAMDENVLALKDLPINSGSLSRMQVAVDVLATWLKNGGKVIEPYTLNTIGDTMKTLWDGIKYAGS